MLSGDSSGEPEQGGPATCVQTRPARAPGTRRWRVLLLCTGNSCRSQMAEALLKDLAGDRLEVFSAGSTPAGFVHPLAVQTMVGMGVSMHGQYSKSWAEVATEPFDVVITLCDAAAKLPCPAFPGRPLTVHWSLPDPTCTRGPAWIKQTAALAIAQRLRDWFRRLLALPLEEMTRAELEAELPRIVGS